MAATGDKTQALETSPNNNSESDSQYHPQHNNENQTQTPKISLYEQSREERIKANLQRMQQLGLKDLSNSLLNSNPLLSSRRGRGRGRGRSRVGSKPPVTPLSPPLPPSAPTRRSSRLQNATPVSYSEVVLSKKDEPLEDLELKLRNSEVYTEEHEKLLGNTERSWTLFVDGYGSDGRRIYDPIKGKTCHQCRQKTLGHRTCCSKCNMVQGQFCGDCLYIRYGEHVLEALENPNWVCPVCRGICNCSLCRQAKGWAPTGSLYRKISQMGFKSVAHYLIQTRRVQTNIEKNPDSADQVSAKRSLAFPAVELPSEESSQANHNLPITSKPQSGEDGLNSEEKENNVFPEPNPTIHETYARKPLLFSESEPEFGKGKSLPDVHGQQGYSEVDAETKGDNEFVSKLENELHFANKEPNDSPMTLERGSAKKHSFSAEPSPDSVAGRLRPSCGKDSSHSDETMEVNDKVLDVEKTINHVISGKKLVKERETHDADKNIVEDSVVSESSPKLTKRHASAMEHSPDSIAGRLKQRHKQCKDHYELGFLRLNKSVSDAKSVSDSIVVSECGPKVTNRPASAVEHSPDSFTGRLKQRCKQGKDHDEQGLLTPNKSVLDAKLIVENPSSGKDSEANMKNSTSGTNMDCIARRLRPRNRAL